MKVFVNKDYIMDGDVVTVFWKGVDGPSERDTIKIYCPVNTTLDDYLDYHFVNVSSTWREGYGSFDIKLFNMRTDYVFV